MKKETKKLIEDLVEGAQVWRRGVCCMLFLRNPCDSKQDVWTILVLDTSAVPASLREQILQGQENIRTYITERLMQLAPDLPLVLATNDRHEIDQDLTGRAETLRAEGWKKLYPLEEYV